MKFLSNLKSKLTRKNEAEDFLKYYEQGECHRCGTLNPGPVASFNDEGKFAWEIADNGKKICTDCGYATAGKGVEK